jgi:hypothetical protein
MLKILYILKELCTYIFGNCNLSSNLINLVYFKNNFFYIIFFILYTKKRNSNILEINIHFFSFLFLVGTLKRNETSQFSAIFIPTRNKFSTQIIKNSKFIMSIL